MHKNAAVADPLANYTVLDCGFELIDSYVQMLNVMLNGLNVNKFLKVQKMKIIHSWNIVKMNMLKRKMKVTDDEGSEGDSDRDDDNMDDQD